MEILVCFMNDESSRVLSSICYSFCFLGFLSLTPTGLSRLKRCIDSFATMLSFFHQKIPILDGGFADRI